MCATASALINPTEVRMTTNFSILELIDVVFYAAAPRRAHPIHQPRTRLPACMVVVNAQLSSALPPLRLGFCEQMALLLCLSAVHKKYTI